MWEIAGAIAVVGGSTALNALIASSFSSSTCPNADGSGRRQRGIYRDDHTKAVGRLLGQGGCSK